MLYFLKRFLPGKDKAYIGKDNSAEIPDLQKLFYSLDGNLSYFQATFQNCSDVVFREF